MKLFYKTAIQLLLCSLTALTFSGVASAVNFEVSKSIEIGATTTDNLALVDADISKERDHVFNIKPSVELKYSGNRFGLIVLGQAEYQEFQNSEEHTFNPSLFLRARGTLIDDLMFLDSSIALTKTSADNSFMRPTDDGEASVTSNTKAFVEKIFGQFAEFYTGYTFSTLAEQAEDDAGSSRHTIDFSLERNPIYNGFLWGLGGYYSQDRSNINEFEDGYFYGKLGAAINETLLAEITYGVESRKLISAANTDNPVATEYDNSPLWEAQLKWSPNELTSLSIGYGDRFFGSGPSMQLYRRLRNSSITASYIRDISRQAASLNGIAALNGNTDQSINNTDSVTINNANNQTPLDEPFIDNRFQLAYKLTGRRSDIIADAVYSDQESLAGIETIRSLLGRVAFDRRLSRFLSLRLQYDYQKSKVGERSAYNYVENRFAIKFIYSFDGTKQFDDGQFDLN